MRMLPPGLTSRNSVKNIMRTSYQLSWTKSAMTDGKISILGWILGKVPEKEQEKIPTTQARELGLQWLKVQDRLRYGDCHVLDRLGHRKQSDFDRLSETYSLSTTKSRPRGTDSRDHPRGRSRPHSLDTSKEDRPKDRERLRNVGESYNDSFSHSYRDENRSLHVKRRRDNESPLSSVSRSDSSNGRGRSFIHRIRNFKSSRRTRMPNNVKTYDGTGDPEDHVKIFQVAAQVERWAMPTWCHMFNSTLIGAARVWFDELPPESIDSYKDLKAAFLAYFKQQKKYVKDLVEIHNIKQKDGETIKDFMERFKVETGRMKGAPEYMRISGFMHGVNNPELIKRLNEHVPKTMEEIMITTTAFIRGEAAAASKKREGRGSNWFTPLTRTTKEILAAGAGKFQPPPPMVTPVEKRGSNKFCDFHKDKGHSTDECMQLKKQIEELVRAGKLSHLIKEIKQGRDQSKTGKKETTGKDKPTTIYMIQSWQRTTRQKVTQSFERVKEITFPPLAASSGTEGPLVIEAEMGGHMIHRMYVDDGSSIEILYEHCFNRPWPKIKSHMVPATTSLTDFSGETIWPLGQLRLLVIIGDANNSTRALMNFMIVRSLSPYNGIIGRSGIRAIQAVPSTVHAMLKFPEERTRPDNFKVSLHPDFPDQEVAIGGTLSDKRRTELCSLLKKNLDIFSWQPSDMTGVPRSVAEHRFNIREGYSPVRQKKRGQAPECAKAIQEVVQKLVEAGIMREVYYHDWLSNLVMVKKHDDSWRMCVDFTDLNKDCPQYCYPLPEIDWKVESLFGYPFKCFFDAYKGYHQIQLAEPDKEKTTFHTGQGVYCYTKMPFGLKNAGATYQRLMDKAFESQIVYVDDMVVKSYTEAEMMRDIEETFRTLRKVNMKLNTKKCAFGLAEGVFLGYVVTSEGIKPCLDKTAAVLQLPSSWTIKEGPRLNYTPIEKLVLSLVFAAKRLRWYFQAHPITVITDQPIKQIMSRPDVAGRLQKWSIMLGEHNITYRPRTSVKGQILADFLIEMPGKNPQATPVAETQHESWTLFTDGSSCVDGSGVGLILTNLKGIVFSYSLRFQFAASNNEAEYEALIAGLRISTQMCVKNVHVNVDSKLVANQVLGTYVAKEDNMVKYLDKVKSLVSGFTTFSISQVPRSKNKKADALSKITSTSFTHLSKQMTPIVDYLKEGTLPGDKKEARKLRLKARQYELMEGILYMRSFLTPWLRCVGPLQAEYVIREILKGSCSMHAGPRKPLTIQRTRRKSNRSLGEGIKARLGKGNKNWVEELPHVLWALRTMIKSSHGDTPFSLTYGTEAVIPTEIGMPTYRTAAVDVVSNDEELRLNLDLLEERERARSNDASHAVAGGKLGPKWEGPYEVTEALGDGAYKLRSMDGTILPRTWNIANLKRCYL
nr:reverse transcriptase domain-containing protein [Tanacetum cinerariifolium]